MFEEEQDEDIDFGGRSHAARRRLRHALTETYSQSSAMATTNWSNTFGITQFDSSLGTLNSVTLTLTGTVLGNANAESLDAAPAPSR